MVGDNCVRREGLAAIPETSNPDAPECDFKHGVLDFPHGSNVSGIAGPIGDAKDFWLVAPDPIDRAAGGRTAGSHRFDGFGLTLMDARIQIVLVRREL
jgi:hypothetical protein